MSAPSEHSAPNADREWRARAGRVVAAVASTGSKRPHALYGPDAPDEPPLHFTRAVGCRVTSPAGRTFVDCTMALGAVALGYAHPDVTARIAEAASLGHVSGLSSVREVEVAERLVDVIPCAERVLFLKSGAEGVAAAVRLARTYTGRDVVVGSGYFGWLDWWSEGPGIPVGAHADYRAVPFDDVAALERAVDDAGDRLAAVVLEPIVERLPSAEWLAAARRLCDRAGAVLVLDEVKTGFRVHVGGYQAVCGVAPDVAVFGKALANGYPLAAVVGRAEVMDAARRTWISSTLAGEGVALAAAQAVLDRHAREDVCATLRTIGSAMRGAVTAALRDSGVAGVSVHGIDPMWLLRFDDDARHARFLEAARGAGVLFKRGAYQFASTAHDPLALATIADAATRGFDAVRRHDAAVNGASAATHAREGM